MQFKKIFAFTLLVALVLCSAPHYAATSDGDAFIASHGIEIPEELGYIEDIGQLTERIMAESYVYPNDVYPYNYTALRGYAQTVREAMAKDGLLNTRMRAASAYTLKDSTVYGTWKDSYKNYNCYGYATFNFSNFVNPGHYSNQNFSMALSIDKMADLVVDDLETQGYWAYYTDRKPTNLANFETGICIRKGNEDYHFMRLTGDKWQHKPGGTNVLTYKYSSPDYKIWTNEHSYKNVSYAGTVTYDSSVKYIIYWPKNVGPQPMGIEKEARLHEQ